MLYDDALVVVQSRGGLGVISRNEAADAIVPPQKTKLPHISFIVLDNLGSNDLGLHCSGILTRTADHIVSTGIYLENCYVLPYCSPTRAAILSGRYLLHTGCHTIITAFETQGLQLDEETLPQVLRQSGYSAHAVGKWHLGHSQWAQTPTFRGFRSFYGYYVGWSDYFTHYIGDENNDTTKTTIGGGGRGYEMHYDHREFCGENNSYNVDERGNYSTHVFTREAIRIIRDHDANQPLFMYLAHQAVHAPDQVPAIYTNLYVNQTSWTKQRQTYAGMLTAADESIANVTAA